MAFFLSWSFSPPGFNFELALQELRGLSVRCRQQHKYRRDRKQPRQMRAVSREVHNFGRNCNGIVNASMAPCESPPKILALAGLWAVFVYSGYLQAPLLKDCNSAHRPHIFPCDVSATVTHLRHHRRTQRPTGRVAVWSCALLLVRWNELHAGLLCLMLRLLLSCGLFQCRRLPLIEAVNCILNRQDGVAGTASSRRFADAFTFCSV